MYILTRNQRAQGWVPQAGKDSRTVLRDGLTRCWFLFSFHGITVNYWNNDWCHQKNNWMTKKLNGIRANVSSYIFTDSIKTHFFLCGSNIQVNFIQCMPENRQRLLVFSDLNEDMMSTYCHYIWTEYVTDNVALWCSIKTFHLKRTGYGDHWMSNISA